MAMKPGTKFVVGDKLRQKVYDFIVSYKKKHDGCSPGIRDIVVGAKCAPMSVLKYLEAMERDGVLKVNGVRGIELVGSKWIAPEGLDGSKTHRR